MCVTAVRVSSVGRFPGRRGPALYPMGHSRPDPTLDSGTTTVSRCGWKIFLYKVCLKIYVLVISCFFFSVVVFFEILKVGRKKTKETKTYFWLTHFFKQKENFFLKEKQDKCIP